MLLLSVVFCVSCTVEPTDTGSNNNSGGGGTTVEKYSITYDKNGATGGDVPVDGNTYEAGATVTVSDKGTLVKTGCKFAGWDTSSAATTAVYSAGATFAMGSANVTLYAVWKVNPTYTVTYDANAATGGTVPTDGNTYEAGATVTVSDKGTLVKTGCKFAGWDTSSAAATAVYSAGATFAMGSANVTLYAVWKPVYTVTYNLNSSSATGTAPTDSSEYAEGDTVTVKTMETEPTLNNYTFIGWATTADSVNGTYGDGSTFSMGSANVTLYAVWTKFTFTFSSGVYTTATYTGAETSVTVPGIIKGVSGTKLGAFTPSVTYFKTSLSSVTCAEGVSEIEANALTGYSSLATVVLANSVTAIGSSAFASDGSLTSVTFGSGLTTIGASAFKSTAITEIDIPASVTSIGDFAFYQWAITTVKCRAVNPPAFGTSVFVALNSLPSGFKIYVPSSSVSAYQVATNWATYSAKIEALSD